MNMIDDFRKINRGLAIRERVLDTLGTADHNGKLDALEAVIDSCENYAEFIEILSEICSAKADHVGENWQDELEEEIWNRRAADLLTHGERVERSFD